MPSRYRLHDRIFMARQEIMSMLRIRLTTAEEAESVLLEQRLAPLLASENRIDPAKRAETKERTLRAYAGAMRQNDR